MNYTTKNKPALPINQNCQALLESCSLRKTSKILSKKALCQKQLNVNSKKPRKTT